MSNSLSRSGHSSRISVTICRMRNGAGLPFPRAARLRWFSDHDRRCALNVSGLSQLGRNRPGHAARAVAIGNFDGVHAGHRKLLRRTVELARDKGWRPSVLTFDPHPTKIVAPERAPKLLSYHRTTMGIHAVRRNRAGFRTAFRSGILETEPGGIRAQGYWSMGSAPPCPGRRELSVRRKARRRRSFR